MDHFTRSNVILGSKLALAISTVVGAPFHLPSSPTSGIKRSEVVRINKRCAALKCRSLKLLEVMKEQDSQIIADKPRTRDAAIRKSNKRITLTMGKMLEQQTSLHSKLEVLLNQMQLHIPTGKNSFS